MPDSHTHSIVVEESRHERLGTAIPGLQGIRPRIVLICHADDPLNREGLARWLASFGDLAGIVELRERGQRMWQRVRREIRRVGPLRFLDVLAFRFYAKAFLNRRDAAWETAELQRLADQFAPIPAQTPILTTHSPNTPEVESFLKVARPTLVIARCKTLLKEKIFSIPTRGTFVMHPGICPQYRNAHGCFWALAEDDLAHVGLTLLKIDRGIDTGPIYGYYRYDFDALTESHHVIQHKAAFANLPALQQKLLEIARGTAAPLEHQATTSREWGQPWLTKYLAYQRREAARRRGKVNVMTARQEAVTV